jgi:hypothetical protein
MKQKKLPSVTKIIGQLDKPGLMIWAQNLAIEACYNNIPQTSYGIRPVKESFEEYKKRISDLVTIEKEKPAKNGTRIHEYIEQYIKKDSPLYVTDYEKQCELINLWIDENIKSAIVETAIEGEGFTGRVDVHGVLKDGRSFVGDFKTQKIKNNKVVFYPEWGWQLAAYNTVIKADVCLSIVIDTGNIEKIYTKEYENMEHNLLVFNKLFDLWRTINA